MMKLSKTTANSTTLTPVQKNNQKATKGIKSEYRFIIIVASSLLVALILSVFVCRFAFIKGDSMSDTLDDGDIVIVSPLAYANSTPQRGDIVLIKRNDLTEGHIVKRIIAVSGEIIEIRSGKIFINGNELNDELSVCDEEDNLSPTIIPDGCYFVIGDNRRESNDSRHWSSPFVEIGDIEGKVIFTLFPKFAKPTPYIF